MRMLICLSFFNLLIIFGCGSSSNVEDDPSFVKETYYDTGEIKTTETFSKDSVRNGSFKQYYRNGEIENEIEFIDNEINGIAKSYYESKKIKSSISYKDGKEEGVAKWYYENGNERQISIYYNGKYTGEFKRYYENGKIKQYIFYSYRSEEVYFVRNYNEKGENISTEGRGITSVFLETDTLNLDDEFYSEFIVVNPNDCERTFYIEIKNTAKKVKENFKQHIDTDKSMVTFKKKFLVSGLYENVAKLTLKDTEGEVYEYEVKFNVFVK